MKKLILTLLFTFLCIKNVNALEFSSEYFVWNADTPTVTKLANFNMKWDIQLNLYENRKLSYNIGKFNETANLYDTLFEILDKHDIYSKEFLFLLLGIAAVETYNGQYLNNPIARGIFQIEPETAQYTIKRAREVNIEWSNLIENTTWDNISLRKQLKENLELQVVMLYVALQVKGVNIDELTLDRKILAKVWKKYWNTYKGKGTVAQFKKRWAQLNITDLKDVYANNK